jgi:hypothetical protein
VAVAIFCAASGFAGEGLVRVSVEPAEAAVWLDGERAGTSPVSIPVVPGPHVVEVHRNGFHVASRVVDAHSGQTTAVHFELVQRGATPREASPRGSALRWAVPPLVGAAAAAGTALVISAAKEPAPIGDLAPAGGRLTYQPVEVGLAVATRFSFVVESVEEDGASIHYTWQFGDGASAEGQSVSHVFQRAGTVSVELRADSGSHAYRHRAEVEVCDLAGIWHAQLLNHDLTLDLVQTGSAVTGSLGGAVVRGNGAAQAVHGSVSGHVSDPKHVVVEIQADAAPGGEPFAYRRIEADLGPACTVMYGKAWLSWADVWVDFSADRR